MAGEEGRFERVAHAAVDRTAQVLAAQQAQESGHRGVVNSVDMTLAEQYRQGVLPVAKAQDNTAQ